MVDDSYTWLIDMWWLALALFLSCIIEVSSLLLSFSNAKWVGLENIRGINWPTLMTSNGSTYSQSVRSCAPLFNWGPLLITVLSIRISIRLWNCRTQFGNSRCRSHTTFILHSFNPWLNSSNTILCLENLTLWPNWSSVLSWFEDDIVGYLLRSIEL